MDIAINKISKEQDKYLLSIDKEIWCTEKKLGTILQELFEKDNIIYNKKLFPKIIPDYCISNNNIKLIIEFQGYQHYTNPKNVYNDIIRFEKLSKEGCQLPRPEGRGLSN